MTAVVLLYVGSGILILWGIAHLMPTKNVVEGFGAISADNRQIIRMEWVGGALSLCFIGVLVLLVTVMGGPANPISLLVYRAAAAMLVVLAVWKAMSGARTAIVPIKICVGLLPTVALLFVLGSIL